MVGVLNIFFEIRYILHYEILILKYEHMMDMTLFSVIKHIGLHIVLLAPLHINILDIYVMINGIRYMNYNNVGFAELHPISFRK